MVCTLSRAVSASSGSAQRRAASSELADEPPRLWRREKSDCGRAMTLKPLSLRLSKVVSTSGLSRQAARQAIERGRVSVNGQTCRAPGLRVEPQDEVTLSGKSVAYPRDEEQLVREARVWCYHKPPGLITTHRDPKFRPTVFDALRRDHALGDDTQHLILSLIHI